MKLRPEVEEAIKATAGPAADSDCSCASCKMKREEWCELLALVELGVRLGKGAMAHAVEAALLNGPEEFAALCKGVVTAIDECKAAEILYDQPEEETR